MLVRVFEYKYNESIATLPKGFKSTRFLINSQSLTQHISHRTRGVKKNMHILRFSEHEFNIILCLARRISPVGCLCGADDVPGKTLTLLVQRLHTDDASVTDATHHTPWVGAQAPSDVTPRPLPTGGERVDKIYHQGQTHHH